MHIFSVDIVSTDNSLKGNGSTDNSWMDNGLINEGSMKLCGALVATPGRDGNGDASLVKTPFHQLGGRLAGPNLIDFCPILRICH
jgi:hypothetical protein